MNSQGLFDCVGRILCFLYFLWGLAGFQFAAESVVYGSGSVGVIRDEDKRVGDKDSSSTISEGRQRRETTNETTKTQAAPVVGPCFPVLGDHSHPEPPQTFSGVLRQQQRLLKYLYVAGFLSSAGPL